jgi:hypothetical protein
MTTTEERLEILRDITAANELVQAVEGGAQALPRLARGDLGALWVIDLAEQAGLAAHWIRLSVSQNVPAAGGRGSSDLNVAGGQDLEAGDVLVGVEMTVPDANVGDIDEASVIYQPGGGGFRAVQLWSAAAGVQIGFANGSSHQFLLVPDYEELPMPFFQPQGGTHQPTLHVTGKSTGGAAGAFLLTFDLWWLRFTSAQPNRNPLLTTETFG